MFENATARLTLRYILILIVISAFFSVSWYQVATQEVEKGLIKQREIIEIAESRRGRGPIEELAEEKEEQLIEQRNSIRQEIITADILIIVLGGLGSYYFARQTMKGIEEAHIAQARFIADASHELRTPLAVMMTETEVALRNKSLPKAAREQLKSNLEEITNLRNLSDSLLQLARLDGNGASLDIQNHKIDKSIAKVVSSVESLAKEKAQTLEVNLEPKLLRFDNEAIESVLKILLENAIKYSPKDSKIEIRGYVRHNNYTIEVQDEGIGVRPSDQERIFERFYRADQSRSSQKAEGNGLGLAIASEIIKNHASKIELSSEVSKGSTFRFSLKVVD